MNPESFLGAAVRLARRRQPGFRSLCASIDLYATESMLGTRDSEVVERLDDLYEGMAGAAVLYPPPNGVRACFAGDSIFIVQEVEPEESLETHWPTFCGFVYALGSIAKHFESTWGNPGLRIIVSYGRLIPLPDPAAWQEHPALAKVSGSWFYFTGVDDAFAKCWQAERDGSKRGFSRGLFWHEELSAPRHYQGATINPVPEALVGLPDLYLRIYAEILAASHHRARLS